MATEYVLSTSPFVVRRRARWGECDPAGVVYTGRFTDYLLSAVTLFHEQIFGDGATGAMPIKDVATPCKALSLVFDGALWPNDLFDMQVTITGIRTSSYDLEVRATRPQGGSVFVGKVSPICIAKDERRSVPIPDAMRERLTAAMQKQAKA